MKRLMTILAAAGLLVCAATYGGADPVASPTASDKLDRAKAAELKGDLARAHTNYESAVSDYLEALHTDRQNTLLYNKLGIVELQLQDRSSARKYFKLALKYDPRNFSALNNLGAVAFLDKKYKSSVGYLKQALALNESSASAHLNLAEAWMGLGAVDRAMTEYSRALELDADVLSTEHAGYQAQVSTPEQRARVSYLIAKAYAKRGNLEGALEYLRRAKDGRYADLARVYTDQEFAALWPDPRLAKIIKR
jgi:tetratricopeptide (TPR) repeat protein